MELERVVESLAGAFGPRGWWPVPSLAGSDGRDAEGYLPGPSRPADRDAPAVRFEIACGAVLVQNARWSGALAALRGLSAAGLLSPAAVAAAPRPLLEAVIRPGGTYRIKAGYLAALAAAWDGIEDGRRSRDRLISIPGIGRETADCILVYCYGVPVFVADAYARRCLRRLGFLDHAAGYEEAAVIAESLLPSSVAVLAESHALFVELGKRHCGRSARCGACPLAASCPRLP